jgi:isocitrate lyase
MASEESAAKAREEHLTLIVADIRTGFRDDVDKVHVCTHF